MTPRMLVALAELLDDLADWLDDQRPGSLDAGIVARCGELVIEVGTQLVAEGAR